MELHSLDRKLFVAKAHDGAGSIFLRRPRAHLKLGRQILLLHDQRVVSGRRHRRGQAVKNAFIIVRDCAGFAVHQMRSAHHPSAKRLADGLMSEADAENGNFASEVPDEIDADAGVLWRARAG